MEDDKDERKCRDVQACHISCEATQEKKIFHVCQESHEVPVQQSCIDEDMGMCGDRGRSWNGGQTHFVFFGKGNMSRPLSHKEED